MTKVDIRRLDSVTTNDTTATQLINENFEALQEAIENTISRDGTTPNFMDADLDLNSYKIINAGTPTNNTDVITKEYFDQYVGDAPGYAAAAEQAANRASTAALAAQGYSSVATGAANIAQAARDFIESDPGFITVSTDLQLGDNSEIHKVNANKTNIDTVADSITNVNTVSADITNVNAVVDDLINIDNVADDLTNIDTVADNITNVNAVADNESNINAVAGNATNINAVNANKTNINAVAGNNTNITAVANNATNINAVNANKTNIDAVAGNNSNITAVANNEANINAVNANKTNIDAVVANATNINTVAGDITNINAVAADLTNIDNASAYAAEAKQWAIGDPSEPVGNSSKYWAEYAESIAEGIGDPANRDLSNLTATGQAVLDSKLDTTQIANCITEIPQDIKLELNNGTLTLKAGSKVYVPNGSGVFDAVTISSDQTVVTVNDGTCMVYLNYAGYATSHLIENFVSGTTEPSSGYKIWYDTTNNYVKRYIGSALQDSGSSFPLAIITVSSGLTISIDQVFNGFGYIGSTVFALPGVKGLIPNGRNADGTLKNIEFEISNVLTETDTSGNDNIYVTISSDASRLHRRTYTTFVYGEENNINYYNGNKCAETPICWHSRTSGVVYNFTSKTAFHAVDYSDFSDLSDKVDTNITTLQNTKQDIATAVNYDNISNCITEIPQDIKLELNNGTLTLKAGSKVYVPNGFDGTTPKFDEVVISSNISFTPSSLGDRTGKIFIRKSKTSPALSIAASNGDTSGSGNIPSIGWYYDTATNKVYRDSSDEAITFPIGICTVASDQVTSIDQVFNGFGYIGSTVFALPGVKGLIPNGRNADGTLKNTEFTTSTVYTRNLTQTGTYYMGLTVSGIAISNLTNSSYNENENINYSGTVKWFASPYCTCLLSSGKITSLTPKTAFHAVDYNDFSDLKDTVDTKANDSAVVKLTGNQTIAGEKTFSSSPIVPTPSTSDNSTKIATTAFVKNQGYITSSGTSTKANSITNQRDTSTALKAWSGTKAQYNAITTKDANTLYNITDDSDITLSLLTALYPVGSIYITTASSCPLATLISGSTWALVSSGRVLQGASSGHAAGTTIEAGLPNITGTHGGVDSNARTADGAFYDNGDSRAASGGAAGWSVGFDASRSSSIYGNSTTVQPPAYVVNIFRRTA